MLRSFVKACKTFVIYVFYKKMVDFSVHLVLQYPIIKNAENKLTFVRKLLCTQTKLN